MSFRNFLMALAIGCLSYLQALPLLEDRDQFQSSPSLFEVGRFSLPLNLSDNYHSLSPEQIKAYSNNEKLNFKQLQQSLDQGELLPTPEDFLNLLYHSGEWLFMSSQDLAFIHIGDDKALDKIFGPPIAENKENELIGTYDAFYALLSKKNKK